ncbi:hypothetical protein [Mycobacterium sp. URHD0025]|uniref:hypothetical protein n=1 Tax=Mycobacterium sp. URHD0025 TaxID=1298864 RepID=UPI0012DBE4BB|nr:hypothetical protein [Mycobacterium sp. URHD0025]
MPPIGDQKPGEEPPPEGQPEQQPPANPMDPSALISPVTDALSSLGSGLFEGVDPTTMLQSISKMFDSTGGSMQKSVSSAGDAWQGASGTAAAAKTTAAISDGQEVAAQSDALSTSLNAAAANVGQARARLIAIITEFAATIAAIGPMIIFPWGWAAAIAAANKAIATTAEVMTELQTSLATQAAQVSAAGAPVGITSAPAMGASSLADLASPLMSMATKGAEAGVQAGTGAASAASSAAANPAIDPALDPAGSDPAAAGGGAALAAGAGKGGGGGGGIGGGGGTLAARSLPMSSMLQAETASAPAQSGAPRVAGVGSPGMMGGAPMGAMGAGQGANASSSNNHTSASFLHTTDQGSEIVGDLGTAAPPVLGEADPYQTPDVELRI